MLNFFLDQFYQLPVMVLGILIALWIERHHRPRLNFRIGDSHIIPPDDPKGRPEYKWLAIEISNENTPFWLRWAFPRDTATSCRVSVTFHDPEGQKIFPYAMIPPWEGVIEPRISDIEKTIISETRVDIEAGDYQKVHFVGRLKGETECYGWTDAAYLVHHWRDPKWKISPGKYLAVIRVNTGGREFKEVYEIINDASFEKFRVEPATRSQKHRIKM